jgi:hypothetical protein
MTEKKLFILIFKYLNNFFNNIKVIFFYIFFLKQNNKTAILNKYWIQKEKKFREKRRKFLKCSNARMLECSNARMLDLLDCSNARMLDVLECTNARLSQVSFLIIYSSVVRCLPSAVFFWGIPLWLRSIQYKR